MAAARRCRHHLGLRLLSLLALTIVVVVVAAADSIDKDDYLYHREDSTIIHDYEPEPNVDGMPDFLYGHNQGLRVVEFYAPWCPHCQHFRKHYVEFAHQMTEITQEWQLPPVKFYAISCTVNRKVCKNQKISGYPKVKLFGHDAINGTETGEIRYWKLHPFDVLNTLGVHVDAKMRLEQKMKKPFKTNLKIRKGDSTTTTTETNGGTKTSSSSYWPVRTKQEMYDDAYRSFDFTMRNSIVFPMTNNATKTALYDFLTLLQKCTPVVWEIQPVLADLLDHFEDMSAKEDENEILTILDRHNPPKKKWSPACTRGVSGMGYTCGLWQLFHILSVGLVEYNLMIASDDDEVLDELSVSTIYAAETIRNFVQYFFGCDACRRNFLISYDNCAFDRCHRLHDDQYEKSEWIQFPVWLWETHSAVNVRLLREQLERDENRIPTIDEEMERKWPERHICPKCYNVDGGWEDETIYKFLRVAYWTEDFVTDEYRTELGAGEHDDLLELELDASAPPSIVLQLAPLGLAMAFVATWYSKRRKHIQTGRHKKNDEEC